MGCCCCCCCSAAAVLLLYCCSADDDVGTGTTEYPFPVTLVIGPSTQGICFATGPFCHPFKKRLFTCLNSNLLLVAPLMGMTLYLFGLKCYFLCLPRYEYQVMAQSWITEVSMEVDASEASQIQNPPLPPPVTAPPPYLGQPPSTTHVPSNTHVPDRTGAVPDGTGAVPDLSLIHI